MSVAQIKNISDVISVTPPRKILSHTVKNLTAPGDNYGSVMLSVSLTVEAPEEEEKLEVVAKTVPPNEYIQELFNTPVTFRNEIFFYKKIVPLLQDFQRSHGVTKVIDFTAKYFGSRLNINNDDGAVDSDAVLVLENLNIAGFDSLDRLKGLGLDAAELVVKNLAQLHAVPLAFRLQEPEVFEKEVLPFLILWTVKNDVHEQMKKDAARIFTKTNELDALKDRWTAGFDRMAVVQENTGCYKTICHNDCWTNNNMYKIEDGRVVESKMVDFQICSYGSVARDLVFFIFSSVSNEVIDRYYDHLVQLYHDTFLTTLKELNCDTTPFTMEALQKEIAFEAWHSQLGHISFMLPPMYAPKDKVKGMDELRPETMVMEISNICVEKMVYFVKEFAKRNWV